MQAAVGPDRELPPVHRPEARDRVRLAVHPPPRRPVGRPRLAGHVPQVTAAHRPRVVDEVQPPLGVDLRLGQARPVGGAQHLDGRRAAASGRQDRGEGECEEPGAETRVAGMLHVPTSPVTNVPRRCTAARRGSPVPNVPRRRTAPRRRAGLDGTDDFPRRKPARRIRPHRVNHRTGRPPTQAPVEPGGARQKSEDAASERRRHRPRDQCPGGWLTSLSCTLQPAAWSRRRFRIHRSPR